MNMKQTQCSYVSPRLAYKHIKHIYVQSVKTFQSSAQFSGSFTIKKKKKTLSGSEQSVTLERNDLSVSLCSCMTIQVLSQFSAMHGLAEAADYRGLVLLTRMSL